MPKNITNTVQFRGGGAGPADPATADPSLACKKQVYCLQRSVPTQTSLTFNSRLA